MVSSTILAGFGYFFLGWVGVGLRGWLVLYNVSMFPTKQNWVHRKHRKVTFDVGSMIDIAKCPEWLPTTF